MVERAIAGHGLGHHLLRQAGGLHGAQRFVVDGNRARLVHGVGVAFDQRAADAVDAEQIGEREAGRAGADDGNGDVHARYGGRKDQWAGGRREDETAAVGVNCAAPLDIGAAPCATVSPPPLLETAGLGAGSTITRVPT